LLTSASASLWCGIIVFFALCTISPRASKMVQLTRLSRRSVSNRMKRDLAIRALKMAIALRSPSKSCIFHSDRGSQYCSHDYQKVLREHGLKPSMSGKGNFYDNAAVETFFKTIKAEMIWRRNWESRRQA
jgi:putative transposase